MAMIQTARAIPAVLARMVAVVVVIESRHAQTRH
jgi:hypothetical protein